MLGRAVLHQKDQLVDALVAEVARDLSAALRPADAEDRVVHHLLHVDIHSRLALDIGRAAVYSLLRLALPVRLRPAIIAYILNIIGVSDYLGYLQRVNPPNLGIFLSQEDGKEHLAINQQFIRGLALSPGR